MASILALYVCVEFVKAEAGCFCEENDWYVFLPTSSSRLTKKRRRRMLTSMYDLFR